MRFTTKEAKHVEKIGTVTIEEGFRDVNIMLNGQLVAWFGDDKLNICAAHVLSSVAGS